jgi:phosphatidylglycerophosphate synthase
LLLYLLIAVSDALDGWLARKLGQQSPFGQALDHGCDVFFILTVLGFFVIQGLIPWWLPAAIAWAFALYVLDSWWRTAAQPQRTLITSRLGHVGGILYYLAVGLVTINVCTDVSLPFLPVGFTLLALLAATSGSERLYHALRLWYHPPLAEPEVDRPDQSPRLTP